MFRENGSAQVEYALALLVTAGVLVAGWQLVATVYVGRLPLEVIRAQAAAARELLWLF